VPTAAPASRWAGAPNASVCPAMEVTSVRWVSSSFSCYSTSVVVRVLLNRVLLHQVAEYWATGSLAGRAQGFAGSNS
jgi:hypothetical protein